MDFEDLFGEVVGVLSRDSLQIDLTVRVNGEEHHIQKPVTSISQSGGYIFLEAEEEEISVGEV